MKNVLLATAAVFGFATAAHAGADRPVTFSTYAEYAVEAEAFELGAGAEFSLNAMPDLQFGVTAVAVDTPADSLDFDHLDLSVSYVFNNGAEVYGEVTLDDSLEYTETVVGVAFSF